MKKVYQKPETKVYEVKPKSLICFSGGTGSDDVPGNLSDENNSDGLWY